MGADETTNVRAGSAQDHQFIYGKSAVLRGLQLLGARQVQAACCSFAIACRTLKGSVHLGAAALHILALVRVCECKLRVRELDAAVALTSHLLNADHLRLRAATGHQLLLIRGLSLLGLSRPDAALRDLRLALQLAPPTKRCATRACLAIVRARLATCHKVCDIWMHRHLRLVGLAPLQRGGDGADDEPRCTDGKVGAAYQDPLANGGDDVVSGTGSSCSSASGVFDGENEVAGGRGAGMLPQPAAAKRLTPTACGQQLRAASAGGWRGVGEHNAKRARHR